VGIGSEYENEPPAAWELYGGGIIQGPQSRALWRRLGIFWLVSVALLVLALMVLFLMRGGDGDPAASQSSGGASGGTGLNPTEVRLVSTDNGEEVCVGLANAAVPESLDADDMGFSPIPGCAPSATVEEGIHVAQYVENYSDTESALVLIVALTEATQNRSEESCLQVSPDTGCLSPTEATDGGHLLFVYPLSAEPTGLQLNGYGLSCSTVVPRSSLELSNIECSEKDGSTAELSEPEADG